MESLKGKLLIMVLTVVVMKQVTTASEVKTNVLFPLLIPPKTRDCLSVFTFIIFLKLMQEISGQVEKISWFDMWFNIPVVKPRFLFKTVDLWSYINA